MIELFFNSLNQNMMRFIISFLFVFAIIFGILQTTKRVKKINEKIVEEGFFPERVNILLAIIIAFISAYYQPLSSFLFNVIPIATIIFILVFFLLFFKNAFIQKSKLGINFMVSAGILLIVLGLIAESAPHISYLPISGKDIFWIAGIILVILIFYAASSQKSEPPQTQPKSEQSFFYLSFWRYD